MKKEVAMTVTEDRAIIVLPGVLARCFQQARHLLLEDVTDDVVYYDYDDRDYNPGLEVENIVHSVEAWHSAGRRVTLIGSSLGGDLTAFVVERLLRDHSDLRQWFDAIVIDPPVGKPSLKAVPDWLPDRLIVSRLGTMIFTVIGWIILLVNRTSIGLPKDRFISRPDAHSMRIMSGRNNFSNEEWREWVKMEAKRCLRGHRVKPWRKQTQWMVRIFMDGSLERALTACRGQRIVVVACMTGNDVIMQPWSADWWAAMLQDPDVIRYVPATHAGYLQNQTEFKSVFRTLL